jgi:hypothetical protein
MLSSATLTQIGLLGNRPQRDLPSQDRRFQVYINIRILTRETVCVIMLSPIVESLAKLGTWAGNGQVTGECL